ncbi:MAG: hypothetical protein LQ350_002940 [Teloschistes chrysophthalmus]|nr:MAG: hypothetical protein LQ350_002940 [Niorma chrysophthalma]
MNSLNLLSSRVIGQTTSERPANYRRRSFSEGNIGKTSNSPKPRRSASQHVKRESSSETLAENEAPGSNDGPDISLVDPISPRDMTVDEKACSTEFVRLSPQPDAKYCKLYAAARRLVKALVDSIHFVLTKLSIPGLYVASCLYDDNETFSPLRPARQLGRIFSRRSGSKSTAHAVGLYASPRKDENDVASSRSAGHNHRSKGTNVKVKKKHTAGMQSLASLELEPEDERMQGSNRLGAEERVKARVSSSSDEGSPVRRSIRIRLHHDETAQKRKMKRIPKSDSYSDESASSKKQEPPLTVATIKSPTSPTSSSRMTKYPRAPAPPRPLIPPSSSSAWSSSSQLGRKTLVIDLDETLIHSLAKGGRMSSGHMVEVKLNTAVGYGGTTLGPQHPILYYVHKRPHCDDFLRKVCKWYELVVFTASVQEYADPVIDWLEQEWKYFTRRYYRQHCTFRNGAYIKDLSSVEPDLSRVIILDNSPLSYIFHEDNAIPIEGWINDPTDNDLLHLVPLLEALQYVMDVRALLALRRGEAEASH